MKCELFSYSYRLQSFTKRSLLPYSRSCHQRRPVYVQLSSAPLVRAVLPAGANPDAFHSRTDQDWASSYVRFTSAALQ